MKIYKDLNEVRIKLKVVLNDYDFVRVCKSTNLAYSDSGLFAISLYGKSFNSIQLFEILIKQFTKLININQEVFINKFKANRSY